MQFFKTLLAAVTVVTAVVAVPAELQTRGESGTAQVTWDSTYDQASDSLDIVACSNGPNGLESKGLLKTRSQHPRCTRKE